VGRLRGWFEAVLDLEVRTAVDAAATALAEHGCSVRDVTPALPEAPVDEIFVAVFADALPYHWAHFGRDAPGYGAGLRAVLARSVPTPERAARAREVVGTEVQALLSALRDVDVLLCATVPAPAPLIGAERVVVDGQEMHVERMLTRLTSIFDAARLPAISVPFGTTLEGMPIGIQLVGRHLDEATLLRAGQRLERATGAS
jgi:aspartyl-tRNA(Asn)/glutamyl-tRNA(Gln) amidotransferase subunit A